ncbi:MAG: AsmA-like C-terminal region-containing protein [Planctomycetota bacterium]
MSTLLMIAAAILAVLYFLPDTLGEQVRRKVLLDLRKHYRDRVVSIGHGTLIPSGGMIFEDITVAVRDRQSRQRRSIVSIDSLVAAGHLDRDRLLDGASPLRTDRMMLRGVRVDCWQLPDGTWSVQSLFPPPSMGPVCPRIDIEDLTLRLHRQSGGHIRGHPIDMRCAHAAVVTKIVDGVKTQTLRARGTGDLVDAWDLEWVQNASGMQIRSSIKSLRLATHFWQRLPLPDSPAMKVVRGFEGHGDLTAAYFRPSERLRRKDRNAKERLRVEATVHHGRYGGPGLPIPINDIRGRFRIDDDVLTLQAAQLAIQNSVLRVSGQVQHLRTRPTLDLQLRGKDLRIERSMLSMLPEPAQRAWDKLRPEGRIDADLQLKGSLPPNSAALGQSDAAALGQTRSASFDDTGDIPLRRNIPPLQCNGDITLRGLSISPERFPYPVSDLVGPIRIANGRVFSDSISGQIGGNRLHCSFDFPSPISYPSQRKHLRLSVDGPIAIDDVLLAALTPRPAARESTSRNPTPLARFVTSLNPRGAVRLRRAEFSTAADGTKHKTMTLDVSNGQLRYDKFPYRLYNVVGTLEINDDVTKLVGFRGSNAGAGTIQCRGSFDAADRQLDLRFDVSKIALDRPLRDSLPAEPQRVWDAIGPSGMLDHLQVDLSRIGDGPLMTKVNARQQTREIVATQNLSLRPTSLPYRLDVTGGAVAFDGSEVRIDYLTAVHEASKLMASGHCRRDPGSRRWLLSVDVQDGSRVHPDSELIAALPATMRKAMRDLQLRGPINVRGWTTYLLPNERAEDPVIDWDLALQLEGNRIGDVGPVHSIRGEIDVRGRRNETSLDAIGRIAIDSVHVLDQQVTQLEGPFRIHDDQLWLGASASTTDAKVNPSAKSNSSALANRSKPITSNRSDGRQADSIPETLRGRLFGGNLEVAGLVTLSSGNFDVQTQLQNARLPSLLADFGQPDQGLSGQVAMVANLQGNLSKWQLLRGGGSGRIRGANLYELPLLVQIFNQLSISAEPKNAFTDAQMNFNIFGDHVTLNDLQVWGDLVSLQGGGSIDRWREIDLTFNTKVSPQNPFSKMIGPLRDTPYTLMTVDVSGSIDNLTIERRALDGVNKTLQSLLPGRPIGRPSSPTGLR